MTTLQDALARYWDESAALSERALADLRSSGSVSGKTREALNAHRLLARYKGLNTEPSTPEPATLSRQLVKLARYKGE